MNKFAVAIILVLGLSAYTPGQAANSIKPEATKAATTSPATPAPSTSVTSKPTQKTAAGDPSATTGKSKHHHKKLAHKHKKDVLIGDGEPLSKIGEHKGVDGGFDFDNSKKFVK